jgi:hypothetical protein
METASAMIGMATRMRAVRWRKPRAGATPHHRFAAWLAILGLLLQSLAALAPMPAAATPDYGPWTPDQICSPVEKDTPSQNGPDRSDLAHHQACQICLTQQLAGNFLAPTTLLLGLAAPTHEPAVVVARVTAAQNPEIGSHSPRAPPAAA